MLRYKPIGGGVWGAGAGFNLEEWTQDGIPVAWPVGVVRSPWCGPVHFGVKFPVLQDAWRNTQSPGSSGGSRGDSVVGLGRTGRHVAKGGGQ